MKLKIFIFAMFILFAPSFAGANGQITMCKSDKIFEPQDSFHPGDRACAYFIFLAEKTEELDIEFRWINNLGLVESTFAKKRMKVEANRQYTSTCSIIIDPTIFDSIIGSKAHGSWSVEVWRKGTRETKLAQKSFDIKKH